MGRLHYTNRKIEGLKLGQVVNRDLIKRIPPHAGSKAAFRDSSIDLDVSGKALTDEGFLEFATALVEALSHESVQGRCCRLEELDLRDNRLGIPSLKALTTIVDCASHDLRDLDLSGNCIHIHTNDDAAVWQRFLASFEQCCLLRRLDLSGNSLGPRGFEVLFRVYAKESPLDLLWPSGFVDGQDEVSVEYSLRNMSLVPEFNETVENIANGQHPSKCKGSKYDLQAPERINNAAEQAKSLPFCSTTRGLRSVPYIVLCDTDMTDACALYLSYIIEAHHMPLELLMRVPPAKAGPPTQQITAYNKSHCRGIIYLSNALLGNAGQRLLELAERRRELRHRCADQTASATTCELPNSSQSQRQISTADSVPRVTKPSKRRQSTRTGALGKDSLLAELDRARSRIQGNMLQEEGPCSSDLWRVAIRALALGRYVQPQRGRSQRSPSPTPFAPKAKAKAIQNLTVPSVSKPKAIKSLTPLAVERDPNRSMNPWNTDFRKKNEAIPPTPRVIPPTPLTPQIENEILKTKAGNERFRGVQKIYRTELPCGFSECAWARILGNLVDAEGILSDDQQVSILRYAMDRKTLLKEREALGLTVATQIWRVLEAIDCLAYEMDI